MDAFKLKLLSEEVYKVTTKKDKADITNRLRVHFGGNKKPSIEAFQLAAYVINNWKKVTGVPLLESLFGNKLINLTAEELNSINLTSTSRGLTVMPPYIKRLVRMPSAPAILKLQALKLVKTLSTTN